LLTTRAFIVEEGDRTKEEDNES